MIPPLLALYAYPFVALVMFASLPRRTAVIWTLVLGYLFLPSQVSVRVPILPNLSKSSMPAIATLLGLIIFAAKPMLGSPSRPGLFPKHPLILALFILLIISGFLTVFTNSDRLIFGETVLPGLRFYEGLAITQSALVLLLPMLLARKYLADEESHKLLLKSLAIAGAIYSFPVVFEIIMSPQLNKIVYGFFPHSWKQHLRGDGFRPVVFLKHGLWLGVFICCTLIAALIYSRVVDVSQRVFYLLLGGWLFVVLLASKVIGAFGTAVVLLPAVLLFRVRLQLVLAAVIASTLLIYPLLRTTDTIPVYQFADLIERYDSTRASSFRYRLFNEDILLERANERAFFGWGGWDRARVFDEEGRDQSTTDGYWVILIGEKGWIGYISRMGLLCGSILILAMRRRVSLTTSGLCLVLAANLINLIPNATLTAVTWMIAGALAGRLELQGAEQKGEDTGTTPKQKTPPSYSRFGRQQGNRSPNMLTSRFPSENGTIYTASSHAS